MKYCIITFGCQMNKSDSERIAMVLRAMNFVETDKAEKADVIVLNTCSVRQASEDRVSGMTNNFAKLKVKKPGLIVCVTGCIPGRDKGGILKERLHGVDLYFPIFELPLLPRRLSEINPNLRLAGELSCDYLALSPIYGNKFQAFVPIQTGCDQYCTYCVVPYARGREKNRPLKDILEEVKNLADKGCLEIILLGQVVNHYLAPDPENFSVKNIYQKNDFAKLLWELNQIKGIERIHYTGPHPIFMDEEVVDALTLPKQVNFLHLPVQAGSDVVLKRMNRKYDREFYLKLVERIRAKRPEMAIGTDIIVGFCGETEADFQDTLDLYQRCDFDIGYLAKYSMRSGTVAFGSFTDDVSKEEKDRRWEVLQGLMEEIVMRKNQFYVGKNVSVLVDRWKEGLCYGNSSEMKLVEFGGSEALVGTIQIVRVEKAEEWILRGKI